MSTMDKMAVYHLEGRSGIYKDLLGRWSHIFFLFLKWRWGTVRVRGQRQVSFCVDAMLSVLRVSHWTWSLVLQLDWMPVSPHAPPGLPSGPSLELQACAATTGFFMGAGELTQATKALDSLRCYLPGLWSLSPYSFFLLCPLITNHCYQERSKIRVQRSLDTYVVWWLTSSFQLNRS